ncbi:MAG: PH domain-containing protein [Methanobrevibacter sp.]|jgi:membrane protein YdbS with pleckstrin-like domain|nr:PH domain-containing protein [Candidatus Methanovirga meridionalis]
MFEKDDEFINENILYKSQPNLIFSIKKAIILSIFLWIILSYSGTLKREIQKLSDPQQSDEMLINLLQNIHINEVVSIIILVSIFILILWIVWILIKWIKTEYILTDSRIILKRGVINLKTDNIMYSHIQDVRLSQGIFGKIFSVGTIEIYTGYNKESLKFANMNTPKKAQKIIFSEMNNDYNFNRSNQFNRNSYNPQHSNNYQDNQDNRYQDNRYQQNPNYQGPVMDYDENDFDSTMDNTIRDLNRENNFRREPKNPKFSNNKNNYSNNRNPSKKQDYNKKKGSNGGDDNLSILEKHSRKFRK